MNNVSIRQLRYFDALAQSLHFGRAAEQCSVSQPALSMQIQEFEREIGAILIERTPQGARLTPEGVEVARRVAAILADICDLADCGRHTSSILSGRLRLGVIPTIAPYVLPKLLPGLRSKYPALDLHLRESQTRYLLNDLNAAKLDVVLLSLPLDETKIETHDLFDDEFVVALPKKRRLPEEAVASQKIFEGERLLLLEEGHCLREQALSFCDLKQAKGLNTFETTSLSTLVQMVANGFGETLLPRMSLETELRHGGIRILPFMNPKPYRKIGLAWRRSSPRKPDFLALGEGVIQAMAATGGKE